MEYDYYVMRRRKGGRSEGRQYETLHRRRRRKSKRGNGGSVGDGDASSYVFLTAEDIEQLMAIYLVSGEGIGALDAAKVAEVEEDEALPHERFSRNRRRPSSGFQHYPDRFGASNRQDWYSSDSSDDDDFYRRRPRPRPQPPDRPPKPSTPAHFSVHGPGPGSMPQSVHMEPERPSTVPGSSSKPEPFHKEYERPRDSVWTPLFVVDDDRTRYIRSEEFNLEMRSVYRPDFRRAARLEGQQLRPLRPSSTPPYQAAVESADDEDSPTIPLPRPSTRPPSRERIYHLPPPLPPLAYMVSGPDGAHVADTSHDHGMMEAGRRRRRHSRLSTGHVQFASQSHDNIYHGPAQPPRPQEIIIQAGARTQSTTLRPSRRHSNSRTRSRERHSRQPHDVERDVEREYVIIENVVPLAPTRAFFSQRDAQPRQQGEAAAVAGTGGRVKVREGTSRGARPRLRGGQLDHEGDHLSDDEGLTPQTFRLRGGIGDDPMRVQRMSSITAGMVPADYVDTTPRQIELWFFIRKRGKAFCSPKFERYTAFQEYFDKEYMPDRSQLSDAWLVQRLREQYTILNRRGQTFLWDMISLRTIGFATFIRFERTQEATEDRKGFIVSAKVPALKLDPNAQSRFQYLLKYPVYKQKMMLLNLDRLAGTVNPDRQCFYVVEILEAPNADKIYVFLILLIIISTGGGSAYAVLTGDAGTGLSIASYVLTVLALVLALVAAGDWLGLKKPDSFAFAYDVEDNIVLGETSANDRAQT